MGICYVSADPHINYADINEYVSDAAKLSMMVADLCLDTQLAVEQRKSKHAHDKEVLISLGEAFPEVMLTEREAHCALLMILGFTSKQTAAKMFLSSRTVEHYLTMVKRKFILPPVKLAA